MTESASLPSRIAVPREQTWDLESVFPSPAAWESACQELSTTLPELASYQDRLKEGSQVLLEYIQRYEEVARLAGRIFIYASNGYAVDTTDQAAAGRSGQARSLFSRFMAAVAFTDPELVSIGFETLRRWMAENPNLAFLRHYVDRLERRQAHVRSGEVEQIMAMVSDPFSTASGIYNSLTDADMTFAPATSSDGIEMEVGQSSIDPLVNHTDREVRRTAWQNYTDGYLAHKNTLTSCLTAAVKQNVFNMRARGYTSSLETALAANFIPVEVFHNLIAVFQKNLPTWHRYWDLLRRVLGYTELNVFDIKAPLSQAQPTIPFQQAVDWIAEGMAPLGNEYVGELRKGCLQQRWVDYAWNKGKREGAFSSGTQGTHPFILMSYSDDVFSLSTLAHELGHSMHSYYSRLSQRFIYSRYGLFVAEVASNFNQAMVRDYLIRTQTDPAFQIALIEEAMSNYHRYFFIMPTLARFELEMHERVEHGAPVSADILINTMADLFKEGYGEKVIFDRQRIGITWAQFGHMYMNFYVYQYATGISGAHALVHGIVSGKEGAVDKYLDFLKSGGSRYPLDALQLAGVDLASQEPVERAFEVLAGLVDRLESLLL